LLAVLLVKDLLDPRYPGVVLPQCYRLAERHTALSLRHNVVLLEGSPILDHQQAFLEPKNFVPLSAAWVLYFLFVHLLFLFDNLHQELSIPLPVLKGCLDSLVQENGIESKKPF
jgi:hypothetical protein